MKAGRSIQEMAAEIMRQSEAKADYLVKTDNIVMDVWNGQPFLHLRDENGVERVEPLDIRSTAHQQLGDYLGIHRRYYGKMLQEDSELLSYNVNRWLQKKSEQRMVRTIDGHARAFLSNRYRRIDNLDIARVTLPIIEKMPGARYESCELTDDYMYIKVVNPKLTAEVTPGDIVQAGIVISNSETGQGTVCVSPLIYRLVCSNGMVVNDAVTRKYHLGRVNTTDEAMLLYSRETIEADDYAFVKKLQDTVKAAVDEARFAQIVSKMRETKDVHLNTKDIPGIVEMVSSSFKLSDEESPGVMQHLIEEGDFTLYGLANAVTRFSQDVESYDRATKLEEIGYSILTMSPELIRRINTVTRKVA